jgi:hypothetical protein
MSARRAAAAIVLVSAAAVVLTLAACSSRGLARQYEYEEEVYLDADGSATVVVNASLPALVALRGLPLASESTARFDRDAVRSAFASPSSRVTRVSRPWRRGGRRFVQVRVETDDIRSLGRAAPFAWSSYAFDVDAGEVVYRQRVGPAAGSPPASARWDGREVVAFRLHLPSRIEYHNAPSREVERGNILSFEQPLADRLAGKPIDIEVRMQRGSILRRTLLVFGLAVGAALLLLAAIVWWVTKKGHAAARPAA